MSESSECENLCVGREVVKLSLGCQLNLAGFKQSNSELVSARSIVTARSEKQQKINKYAETLSEITDFIYLSGIGPASDAQLLESNKITYVLNLCGDVCAEPALPSIKNFVICLKDSSCECVEAVFYMCFVFIHDARTRGERVLVHCQQGISRSSCIVIAYLMVANDLTYEEAYGHVRAKRPVVSPNPGFIFQLCDWWRRRHCCIFSEEICIALRARTIISGILTLDQAVERDSAIRDLRGSHFVQCIRSSAREAQPRVFRFAVFSSVQDIWVLKNVGTQMVSGQREYVFDPRFVYVITGLALGTIVLFGDDANEHLRSASRHQMQRSKSDLTATSFAHTHEIAAESRCKEDLALKSAEGVVLSEKCSENELLFCSPVNAAEFLRTHGHLAQATELYEQLDREGLRADVHQSLALRLAEMEFFDGISSSVEVMYQRAINTALSVGFEDKKNTPECAKLFYLLGKLGALKQQFHLRDDFIESVGTEKQPQQVEELMLMNPAMMRWQLEEVITDKDVSECTIFEPLAELDAEFELIVAKLSGKK